MSGLFEMRSNGVESRRWTGAQRVQLEMAFLASLVALTVTPYGPKLAAFPVDMAFSHPAIAASIVEWQPMSFSMPFGKLFLGLVLGFLLAQVVLRPTWQLAEMVLLLAGIVASFLHIRFLLLFVPFGAPFLAVLLSRWMPPYEPGKDKHALNALLMILVVLAIVRFFPSQKELEASVSQHWPVKAVQYVEGHPPPRPLFNTYGYGGYLIYWLDGQNKVFIDGRAELYEHAGVLGDYLKIAGLAPNALILLRAYNVQSCLIGRNEPLATLLTASSQWQKIYADDMSVLFVRSQTGK